MDDKPKRANYVDWLRVLAVLALFPFHAGQIFNTAAFYVKDQNISPVIMVICDFFYQWHMPLFMFLAGIGSYYALRFRSGKRFLLERLKRLFIPLVFGTLIIIPPVTYIRMFGDPSRVWHEGFSHNAISGFDKGYFAYYPFFFNGIYPNGNFEWGHLWFLAYLFTFSLVALPVFLYLKSEKGAWIINSFRRVVSRSAGIFLFFIPIAVIETLLRKTYPNMQNLISDWANVLMFFTVFVFGYIMVSADDFGKAIDRHWKTALPVGLLIAILLALFHVTEWQSGVNEEAFYVVEMILRGTCIWFSLIGLLGCSKRYFNRGGKFLEYACEAAFPVYIIHLPVIVFVGYYLTNLDLPLAAKYLTINFLSLVLSVLLYELVIRRFDITRFFFGLKKKYSGIIEK